MFFTKSLGINPDNQKEITLNTGRFGPYLKYENKSARIENIEEIFSIGLNRAITLIAEAKPGRVSSSMIKDLGEHPEDKKPVRVMKGQYGPYIKYKSLNATIPEEKDPTELTMDEALILIEKRKEYDKTKKEKNENNFLISFLLNTNSISFANKMIVRISEILSRIFQCKGNIKDKTISAGQNIIKDTKDYQNKEWSEEKAN